MQKDVHRVGGGGAKSLLMHVDLWLENYIQAVLVGLASAAVPLKAALHMMLIHCVLFLPFGVGVISCADP